MLDLLKSKVMVSFFILFMGIILLEGFSTNNNLKDDKTSKDNVIIMNVK